MPRLVRLVGLQAFLIFAALSPHVAAPALADEAMVLPLDPRPLVVDASGGKAQFRIEVADDSAERARGLMFRKSMPTDRGMLFVFEQTQSVGFWMKNTILPLDLVFIGDDGRVKAIKKGEPFSEAVISPDARVRFVLELNAGVAAKTGIRVGALAHHPEIDVVDGASN